MIQIHNIDIPEHFAHLHECCRKNVVLMDLLNTNVNLNISKNTFNFDSPCFYFPDIESLKTYDQIHATCCKADDLINKDNFFLPYKEMFFAQLFTNSLGPQYHILFSHCKQDPFTKQCDITIFRKWYNPYDTKLLDVWNVTPKAGFGKTSISGGIFCINGITLANSKHHHSLISTTIQYIKSLVVLLAEPKKLTQTEIPIGILAYSVNSGRAKGKLKPLGQVIKIELPNLTYVNSEYHIKSSSKCSHDRRGHYRTLPSGKEVFIKSSKINGGRTKGAVYLINQDKL